GCPPHHWLPPAAPAVALPAGTPAPADQAIVASQASRPARAAVSGSAASGADGGNQTRRRVLRVMKREQSIYYICRQPAARRLGEFSTWPCCMITPLIIFSTKPTPFGLSSCC